MIHKTSTYLMLEIEVFVITW